MVGRVALLWVNQLVSALFLTKSIGRKLNVCSFTSAWSTSCNTLVRYPGYRVSFRCTEFPPLLDSQFRTSLEIVIWLVPSLVGGAIAVSFIGMLLGPMYPLVVNHARHVLPPWLLSGSIGWIAGFGQAGSAFLPFITGALASKVGIKVLQPL